MLAVRGELHLRAFGIKCHQRHAAPGSILARIVAFGAEGVGDKHSSAAINVLVIKAKLAAKCGIQCRRDDASI